jgi:SET domain-containing protein
LREKQYDAKGIGCYMFRIDDENVIDATFKGNITRFVNHCCEVFFYYLFLFYFSLVSFSACCTYLLYFYFIFLSFLFFLCCTYLLFSQPNCIARVHTIEGKKHILLFTKRAVATGEELTYDCIFIFLIFFNFKF